MKSQKKPETEVQMTAAEQTENSGVKYISEQQEMKDAQKTEETKYQLLGERWGEDLSEEEEAEIAQKIREIEAYHYYDADAIFDSIKLQKKAQKEGEKLVKSGKATIETVEDALYDSVEGTNVARITCNMDISSWQNASVTMILGRKKVEDITCTCDNCTSGWYYYYRDANQRHRQCRCVAASAMLIRDYLKKNAIGDATDYLGENVLGQYMGLRYESAVHTGHADQEELFLTPGLMMEEDGTLRAKFKVGSRRMYIIRNLSDFWDHVQDGKMMRFGSKTDLYVGRDAFEKGSRRWLEFLENLVQEEKETEKRMKNEGYYYEMFAGNKGGVRLTGQRLDTFAECMGEKTYELQIKNTRQKGSLRLQEKDPHPVMHIQPARAGGQVDGITVFCKFPEVFAGREFVYYIEKGMLCRMSREYMRKMRPFLKMAEIRSDLDFTIGRGNIQGFYEEVLAGIRDCVEIAEDEPEIIDQYMMPSVHIVFYLDAQDHNAFCKVRARYGAKEYPLLEGEDGGRLEPFRAAEKETLAYQLTEKWFPERDEQDRQFHCGGDEEAIYELMRDGVNELLAFGEVQCTNRFRNLNVIRHVKVSVGVQVKSDLMNLEVSADDVSREELLDLLKSYREKKKYHILRSGEFVDLNDDALRMMDDMMRAMNVSLKEFVKGKMHIPLYRALYLDKMLEENEAVYHDRDSHFKNLVKNFKTVNDADFKTPQSLGRVLRNYQVTGYKWLRTLEEYGFGGILADDMGLGKTLQVIALLQAAAEQTAQKDPQTGDNQRRQALIVTPASLVYNWGSEIEKFAPTLSYVLITGTQTERYQLIESSNAYDVLITSYDLLKRDIDHYEGKHFYYEIIDEAQYIKNHNTAAAKSVKAVQSRVRYALTGTPIENRLSELWSIFDYLMPGFLYKYDVFRKEMETPIVKNEDENAVNRLQKMVRPFILRRLKENVLKELPEKLEESYYVKMEPEQRKLYDAQVVHMQQVLAGKSEEEFQKSRIQVLAELTRLRQVCCDPALCYENYQGESAKLEACVQLIQSAVEGEHKILLFSQFTSMLDILRDRLQQEGISWYMITGQTPKKQRLEMVEAFNQDDTNVFLISLKAGGVGLNLTGADVVVHYDPWWNLAAQNQATDRAHRIGQTQKVTVYKMLVKGTIEEKIQKMQETKKDLADKVLTGEGAALSTMTREDFLELLEA